MKVMNIPAMIRAAAAQKRAEARKARACQPLMDLAKALTFTTCSSTGENVRQDTVLAMLAKATGLDEPGEDEPPAECLFCGGAGFYLVASVTVPPFGDGQVRQAKMACPMCGGWGIVFKEPGRGGHRGQG